MSELPVKAAKCKAVRPVAVQEMSGLDAKIEAW
jgi:hypothetical protein